MATEKLTGHTNLPHDPAECCRAIVRALLPLADFEREQLPGRFAHLVNVLASSAANDAETNDPEAWDRRRIN